jgi:hypothetical protein
VVQQLDLDPEASEANQSAREGASDRNRRGENVDARAKTTSLGADLQVLLGDAADREDPIMRNGWSAQNDAGTRSGSTRHDTTSGGVLVEELTTVVDSPPLLHFASKPRDPDDSEGLSPITLFPQGSPPVRETHQGTSGDQTPSYIRDIMAAMEQLNNSIKAQEAASEAQLARLRALEERNSVLTSDGDDVCDDLLDGMGDSYDDDEDEEYTSEDYEELRKAKEAVERACSHDGCGGCANGFFASGGDGVPGAGWTTVKSRKEQRRESSKSLPSVASTPASSSNTGSTSTSYRPCDTTQVSVGDGVNRTTFQFLSEEALGFMEQFGQPTTSFMPGAFHVQFPKGSRPPKDNAKDYQEFQGKIVKGLSKLFGTAAWAETRSESANFKGGTTSADVAERTIELLENAWEHTKKYDMTAVILIPKIKAGVDTAMSDAELKNAHPTALFDLSDGTSLCNLFKEWGLMELAIVCFWQRYLNLNKYVLQDDRDSNGYFWLFLLNSMTYDLKEKVLDTLNKTFGSDNSRMSCIGGATLLYALIQSTFGQSRSVFESYAQRISDFESKGLRGTEGENMAVKAKSLLKIINCLYFAKYLNVHMITQTLIGLQKCGCSEFSDYFKEASRNRLKNELMRPLSNTLMDARPASQLEIYNELKNLILEGRNLYLGLCEQSRWNTGGKKDLRYNVAGGAGGEASKSRVPICPNCNGAHRLKECPLEHDEERLKQRRKEFMELLEAEGGKYVDGHPKNVGKEFWAKKRAMDEARKKKEGVLTGSSKQASVPSRDSSGKTQANHRFHNGTIQFRCTKCTKKRRWGSHTTDLHDLADSQGTSFDLVKEKPNDPAVQAFASLRQAKLSGGGASTGSSNGSSGGAKLTKEEWTKKLQAVTELIESKAPGSEEHKSAMHTFRQLSAMIKDF